MIAIAKLKKVDPNANNLKAIIPKAKGIYFWCTKDTDKVVYIGTGSGVNGLYNRIVRQHLNPKYIEYREEKQSVKDFFQQEHPIIKEVKGVLKAGIDQSAFRKNIGRTYNIKPGEDTVAYIKDNLYLKLHELEDKEELMLLEKELIQIHQPVLNISHKYKISNR
ncbi:MULTISPECIES: GIY-YIG nuclease family protein [unclassified Polaribacter]|uniref:GIY-YIG nuclease family protein n=1 Tax=unclassified Polaribacter TaxID=196858 RepID=UPI0011BE9EEE|nr:MULTISPECIES: hypothetical protein [unclassified Polaribacter]TXD53588.1 hypothetical protein ES043_02890 [Polaribacter sp. IC063]TXD62171.1 hypothetical protein ES044_02815 [Polaribacter sp. IC066]